jgi:hypothetical protein
VDDITQNSIAEAQDARSHNGKWCKSVSLSEISVGNDDKLGHRILDILWCGPDYAVYRSVRGIYVHFSDCPDHERRQREAFTEIAPELCELRVFTSRMRRGNEPSQNNSWFGFRVEEGELFDHNIAQAIMLTMEGKVKEAKDIVKAALAMAVRRVTNDNTIRYLRSCMIVATVSIVVALSTLYLLPNTHGYMIAIIFGAVGAVFSIITRIEAFEMKPCQQSDMNYWMSAIRVIIGIIGGVMLLLLLRQSSAIQVAQWEIIAAFGFIGGFSERLLKILIQQTANSISHTSGTPVQEARRLERGSDV